MNKKLYWLTFADNYDVDAVDEICDKFNEADHIYADKRVRFYGCSERASEFIRALKTEEIVAVIKPPVAP